MSNVLTPIQVLAEVFIIYQTDNQSHPGVISAFGHLLYGQKCHKNNPSVDINPKPFY